MKFTYRKAVLVALVVTLAAGGCAEGNEGGELVLPETTAARVVEPDTTEAVNDVGEHTHEHEEADDSAVVATYPKVEPVKCFSEYVHAHPTVLDAHVENVPEDECHTHTCETAPHSPEISYSGDSWPCPAAPATTVVTTTTALVASETTVAPARTDTSAPTTTSSVSTTTTEPVSTTTTTEPVEQIDGGLPVDLARLADGCPGELMGRMHSGQPTGCRLGDGTVLCLTAPESPTGGDRLYKQAVWKVCPDFDANRPPCDTSKDASDHAHIVSWEHVFTSSDQTPYIRPILDWKAAVSLEPGLWFGELCVRHNEGSAHGAPGPQPAFLIMDPHDWCDGLPGAATGIGQDLRRVDVRQSNGTQELRSRGTAWAETWVFECTDRTGPYFYDVLLSAVGDWVFKLGRAGLPFEIGTYHESVEEATEWMQSAIQRESGR